MLSDDAIRTVKNSLVVGWVILMFVCLLETVAIVAQSVFRAGVGVLSIIDFLVAVTSYGLIAFALSVVLFLMYEVVSEVLLK